MNRRGFAIGPWACGMLLAFGSLAPGPQEPAPPADELKAARQDRLKAATDVLAMCREFLVAPPGEPAVIGMADIADKIEYWERQVTDARLDLAESRDERIAILAESLKRCKELEEEIGDLAKGGDASRVSRLAPARATFHRAEAAVRLLKEKQSR